MRNRKIFCQTISSLTPCMAQRLLSSMLFPLLHAFSRLLPLVFPREWIGARPSSIVAKTTVRGSFRELCLLVHCVQDRIIMGSEFCYDFTRDIIAFHTEASALLEWVTHRRRWGSQRAGERRVNRMRLRLNQLQGKDLVHSRLYMEISAIACNIRNPAPVRSLLQFACDVGGVDRMLELSRRFRYRAGNSSRFADYLDRLIVSLCTVRRSDYERALAVVMALHPRLGVASALGDLGGDILPRCVSWLQAERIPVWQNVIGICFSSP